jgi:hypothetical protein
MRTVIKGLIIGVAATQALDALGELMYRRESRWLRFRENRARGFLHVYERAVGNMASAVGITLTRKQKQRYGWAFHKVFGTLAGVGFALARERYPRIGLGKGLAFGSGFFAVVDELLIPLLRWTPGPTKFSWKVHARGAATHVAYGVAAELAAEAIETLTRPRRLEMADEDILPPPGSRPSDVAPAFYAP